MAAMLDAFHPLVRDWFSGAFGAMTEPQTRGWPAIRAGDDVLISAPTGSGKTLAAFTLTLDELVRAASEDRLEDRTLAVYVSPLKALTNDVRENLEKPLAAIVALSIERLIPLSADPHGGPHGRYDAGAAPADAATSAARARDDAGIALYFAYGGKIEPALCRRANGDRRRDSRDGGRQTRIASRADARAP